jgi:hypothetical protein
MNGLDLRDAVLVGHSTGGGELARYISRHGTSRVSKMVPLDTIVPVMLQKDGVPGGVPKSVIDSIRAGVAHDRSSIYKELSAPFFGTNRPNSPATHARGAFHGTRRSVNGSGALGARDCGAATEAHGRQTLTTVAMRFEYAPGAAPIYPDEAKGLIPAHLTLQRELNEYEESNILEATTWLFARRRGDPLDERFIHVVHGRMFNQTWKWAGKSRRTDKNLGVSWFEIPVRLRQMLGDVRAQSFSH